MTPAPSLQELIETVKSDTPGGNVLEQLTQVSRTVSDLEEVSDSLLGHFVDRCRRSGHSWSEISAALGVSKQAAHKRFSPSPTGAPTFERFTARARAVLSGAADEARLLGHGYVGPEHLLLALFQPSESLAAQALAAAGITRTIVVEQVAPPGTDTTAPGSDKEPVPYNPAAVEVLRGAVVEALQLGHNHIGTEHLLLALFRQDGTPATRALAALGVSHEQTEARITELLAGYRDQ